jgi:hypothetical protein
MNRDEHTTGKTVPEEKLPSGGGSFLSFNLIALGITFVVMYELFPYFTQNVVFNGILRNGWEFGPFAVIAYLALRYYRRNREGMNKLELGAHRRPISMLVFALVLTGIWTVFVHTSTDYFTYKVFASGFVSRNGLIPSSPSSVRFTPRENACNDIANSISTTGEHIDCKLVAPIITNHGFGYVAPITPNGTINTFVMQNPGFMMLDDSLSVDSDPEKRLRRIDEVQQVGPGMEWFDNLAYALAKNDFFANYDAPHYLALDDSKPDKLTLVVPKIKYSWLWRLPYWGGIVLVHSNGVLEDLTAEKAIVDPRLKGKWIYPLALVRHYIEIQNYGLGWGIVTPYVYISGKLEIEQLPGSNQFPFVSQGLDGKTYLVTATKGQGSARGLLRMYFTDASTGVGEFHQFGTHEVVYGAGASKDRLTNIPNYQWYHEGEKGGTGQIVAIEPVYVVRPNDPVLYWKYTITNVKNSGISATAVANSSRPDEIKVFTHRADFDSWLHGNEISTSVVGAVSGSKSGVRDELLGDIESLVRQLNVLRTHVESLPPGQ